MSKKLLFLISFVLVLTLANSAFAQPETWPAAYWSGFSDGSSWDDPNNWWTVDAYWDEVNHPTMPARIWAKAPNAVPDADTIVMVGQGTPWYEYPAELAIGGAVGHPVIDGSENEDPECYQIYISTGPNDTNGPGRLDVSSGTLTSRVYEADWLGMQIGNVPGGTGVVNLSGGDILLDNYDGAGGLLTVGGNNYWDTAAGGGIGTLNMTGGTLTCYHMDCPDSDAIDPCTTIGYINLYGGTFYTSGDETWTEFWMGDAGMFQLSRIDITDGKAQITSHDDNELYWLNLWIDEGKITAFGGDPNLRSEIYADYDLTNPGKTTLSAIATEPNQAWNPQPLPGATVDPKPVTLSWTPGDNAVSHVVFISTDRDEVVNGTAPNTPTGANSIGAGDLEFDTYYFWQVDEVNGVHPNSPWPGDVWFFKTTNYTVVDDFESYNYTDNLVQDTWVSKTLTVYPEPGTPAEFDPDLVHLGKQAMMINYWPNSSVVREFDTPQDWSWSTLGVEALTLYFRGTAGNPEAPMSVTLTEWVPHGPAESATVAYDGDASDLSGEGWYEWNIRLQDFNDIEPDLPLTAIGKITIGFGGFVGDGIIYIDDIQLYPTRCIPAKAPFDVTGDCITDYQELDVLAGDWLEKGKDIPSVPPSIDPNRLVRYTFDTEGGSGTIVHNSDTTLGSDANGTIFDNYAHGPGGPLTWETPGAPHPNATEPNYCIQLSAFDEQAVIMDCNFNDVVDGGFTTNHLTITCWIKRSGDQLEWCGLVFCSSPLPVDDPDPHAGLSLGANDDWMPETAPAQNHLAYHWQTLDDACDATPDGEDQIWWWRSGLLVPDGVWTFCAVAVEPEKATVYMMPAGGDLYKAVNIETHVPTTFEDPFNIGRDPRILWGSRTLNGQIDDVQIFDYALSEEEILHVAQESGGHVGLVSLVDFDDSDNIDFFDYAILMENWLDEVWWP